MTRPRHGLTLRVSLLTQCQYDCAYCRPGALTPAVGKSQWLSAAEYGRLARVFAQEEIGRVRFTGGEPLLRPEVVEVVGAFRAAMPGAELALTTNGQLLAAKLPALVEAGLQRATVHVDSLDPERYRALMGDGELEAVLAGVLEAQRVLQQVKLNVVIQEGKNEDEIPDFLAWSRAHRVEVRFIELMNTGSAVGYTRQVFFSGQQILARAGAVERLPRRNPSDPAALYRTADGVTFGVIASDTEPFCADCNRLRLNCAGLLRGCLYQPGGVPLGPALREGATDRTLGFMLGSAIRAKQSHHPLAGTERAQFSMADAGG
ncbi:MAG: molybdenum cofactor biosynthesis protein [Myxococcaceae bacterium]|nr:molybdenum cofactor biosynthesis protein [Myxococcaceae bacterium]